MSKQPILEITDLTKVYGRGRDTTQAVAGISLAIPRGSFFGLLGPNGAGKSTTIHCITGITQPSGGQIVVDGTNVVTEYRTARRKIGLSPQEFNVDIFSTPVELMDYMGGYYGIPAAERRERIEELIERFGLNAHRDVKFQKLSGGLKRRAMLGRALVHTPDLLILDEPTAGIDVEQRHDLWVYLQEMNSRGKTIILTSHYLEEVEYLCNEIAIINHGQIVAAGSKASFMAGRRSLEEAYLAITQEGR
ncbi:MAG: ABC transporter ATP-binding protein [Patescibacteria group bacterium]